MHSRVGFAGASEGVVGGQVFARCNFCNQPLAMSLLAPKMGMPGIASRSRGPLGLSKPSPSTPTSTSYPSERKQKVTSPPLSSLCLFFNNNNNMWEFVPSHTHTHIMQISSCPSCSKPLPLCSICLLPLVCTPPAFGSRLPTEKTCMPPPPKW